MNTAHHRSIRSFVLRQGRMTKAQQQAFEQFWQNHGVEYQEQLIDLDSLFNNGKQSTILEIGFGNGSSLAEMAEQQQEINFLGVEVHKPGVGSLLMECERRQLHNLKCINHDAIEVLTHMLPDNSLDGVQLFFPDPWPKKKHHKRRILNIAFLDLITRKLKTNGKFHMATDWWPYAEEALLILNQYPGLQNQSETGEFSPRPDSRPKTRFEQRGEKLGHGVWDLLFSKKFDN